MPILARQDQPRLDGEKRGRIKPRQSGRLGANHRHAFSRFLCPSCQTATCAACANGPIRRNRSRRYRWPHPQQTSAEHVPDIFTGRAQSSGETLGRLRITYRRDDHRILGLHVLAEGAVDLMGEAALAVRNGLTLEQIAASIHPHLTEAFCLTALSALAQSLQGCGSPQRGHIAARRGKVPIGFPPFLFAGIANTLIAQNARRSFPCPRRMPDPHAAPCLPDGCQRALTLTPKAH